MKKELVIGGRQCYLLGNEESKAVLFQPFGEHNRGGLDTQTEQIAALSGQPFQMLAFPVQQWNEELSPWKAPAVFRGDEFGEGAGETLSYVLQELVPAMEKANPAEKTRRYYLGGYSLAGLFALWASYQTDLFEGVAAVSPSVWFPGWGDFSTERKIRTKKVYLSLGKKEEKAGNRTLATVGNAIRAQQERMAQELGSENCVLEWNPGNHFVDADLRTAKGFAWLLRNRPAETEEGRCNL